MEPVFRQASRLVVIDPNKRILLFQYEDDLRRWWATPGGGLEGEETFEEAAVREAEEELSLACTMLMPLWRQTAEFMFRGQLIRQVERYFLTRLPQPDPELSCTVREVHQHEGIIRARWWSLNEIETTSEQIFPVDLCQRLREMQL
jgi:8-oxo-dGTP pyrophosphatase MutT (NUDIX family)